MAKAREVLAATLALLALSAALASSATSEIQQTQTRPNIVVLMTDDQTVESMRVMTNVNTLLAARGTTFTNNFASFPLCCPSQVDLHHGPVRPQPHDHGERAARRRLREARADTLEHAPGVAAARRATTPSTSAST